MASLPSEILLFQSDDGETRVDVRLVDDRASVSDFDRSTKALLRSKPKAHLKKKGKSE